MLGTNCGIPRKTFVQAVWQNAQLFNFKKGGTYRDHFLTIIFLQSFDETSEFET